MRISRPFTLIAVLAGLMAAAAAVAQQPAPCAPGQVMITTLDISGIRCDNCTIFGSADPAEVRWEFGSEPVIEGDAFGVTGNARLLPGDVIVAIDGHLITTSEGGRRFGRPDPYRAADLRIRREGRELSVAIDPTTECRRSRRADVPSADVPAPPAPRGRSTDSPPPPPLPPARRPPLDSVHVRGGRVAVFPAPTPPVLPALLPAGWLGLSFQCTGCQVQVEGDSARTWTFPESPTIVSVEGGSPAARAGLRSGDRLVSIDGLSLMSAAGGARFGAVSPGQSVSLGYERGSNTGTAVFVTGTRALVGSAPGGGRSFAESYARIAQQAAGVRGRVVAPGTAVSPPLAAPTPPPALRLDASVVRYTGRLGDTMIEVTGEPVTVTQDENEIVIRTSTGTIRLRREGPTG
jgi:membrane-associated protease RseP (regulator of RpoE activity)